MNGVIYSRVSSKEQIDGTSLDSQETACLEYARTHGIKVVQVFREEGESAKFADRTELLKLLEFCSKRSHGIEVLIVWKVDRFARNVEDHYHIKATLRRYGVQIASATEPIQTDANGKLLETILAGFAQFDNEIRTARTIQGMRQRIRDGIHPWKPPIGYMATARNGTKKTEPDSPDPRTFPVLKAAWERFAAGTHTKADVVRFLRREGLNTTDAHPISPQFIDRLLTNHFYAGILTDPWSCEQFTGRHVPMITVETFALVQAKIQGRHKLRDPVPRSSFPLRGLVRCPTCQHYLTASFSRGRTIRYPYYRCNNRECQRWAKSISAQLAASEFSAFLVSSSLPAEVVPNVVTLMCQIADDHDAQLAKRRRVVAAALKRTDAELQAVLRMASRGLVTESEFVKHRDALRTNRLELAGRLERQEDAPYVRAHADTVLRRAANLEELSHSIEPNDLISFQRLLLPDGYSFGLVGTADKSRLCSLAEVSNTDESRLAAFVKTHWNQLLAEMRVFSKLLKLSEGSQSGRNPRFQQSAAGQP